MHTNARRPSHLTIERFPAHRAYAEVANQSVPMVSHRPGSVYLLTPIMLGILAARHGIRYEDHECQPSLS